MSFVLLHHENSFCGHEACVINTVQITSVLPISRLGKIYAGKSQASVHLVDGSTIYVRENIETILGMLRTINGGEPIVGTGPRLQSAPGEFKLPMMARARSH